ncbi:hypothetical protein [Proteiniborus sp.]|uniref:hypothetical protein n=1 Tax=Proteiniborus sp. TaxID=2079015 RepID=UPI00332D3B93
MKYLLKKILLRAFLLLLILVIPIVTFIFIEDNAQITWSINNIKEMNKYTIIAEFLPEKEEIIVTEKIKYINKTSKNTDKVFFYISDILNSKGSLCQEINDELAFKEGGVLHESGEIESIKIKNKKADFKIIDNDILMINLDKKLEKSDKIDIEIKYKATVSYLSNVTNEGTVRYMLKNWYPVVAKYNNGWQLKPTYCSSSLSKNINYFLVEIIVPEEFEVEASGRLIEKTKKKRKFYYKFQDQGTLSFNVNIISTKY